MQLEAWQTQLEGYRKRFLLWTELGKPLDLRYLPFIESAMSSAIVDMQSLIDQLGAPRDWALKEALGQVDDLTRKNLQQQKELHELRKLTSTNGKKQEQSLTLNPRWVLQLLGMPANWLDEPEPGKPQPCEQSATQTHHKSHSSSDLP